MPTTVGRCGRLRRGGNLRHEQNQGVTRAFRREKQSGDLLGHHGRHHAGSGDAPRRPRARRVPKAPLVLAPSPQNASIRSGSSGCWDCFGGAVRTGARRDPTAPRPDRPDGTRRNLGDRRLASHQRLHTLGADDTLNALGCASAPTVNPGRAGSHERPLAGRRVRALRHCAPSSSRSARPRRRCATASAKLSATRRPRASMSGSVV